MAITPSSMMPLGTRAPAFTLPDVRSGHLRPLKDLKSDVRTVVMFICNHCPFVKHILEKLVETAAEYGKKGISFIAINANDVNNYPEDSPEKMKELATRLNFSFPYLFDETQETAHAYDAACTPDFFIFDENLKCVYRGRFDEARPGQPIPVTGQDLKAALDALLNHRPIPQDQRPSVGCNIKWQEKKRGFPPRYV